MCFYSDCFFLFEACVTGYVGDAAFIIPRMRLRPHSTQPYPCPYECNKRSQEMMSDIDKCAHLFYITPMKLRQYAKQQGINYRTALRWFRDGAIQNYQAPSGTIIVTETVNAIRHHLTEDDRHLEEWAGQVGVSEAGRGIRRWVSAQRAARSPEYAEESKRQLSARHGEAS